MATIRAYRAEVLVADAKLRVYRGELTTTGIAPHIQVYRAELACLGQASLGADLIGVEPWTTVTLTATAPDTPTSWTFTQTSGPAVTLVPSGNTVSFEAPPALITRSVAISVVANYSGGAVSGQGTVNVEILHATEFVNTATGWVPARFASFDPEVP
jgi:hypothetical protein